MRVSPACARLASLVAIAAACKGGKSPAPTAGSNGSTQAPTTSPTTAATPAAPADPWQTCAAALRAAQTAPPNRRAMTIIDACTPCGDWRPILDWQRAVADGGPTHAQLEHAMVACDGFCDPTAKQRFLSALEDGRQVGTRKPWRALGEHCKAAVSAVPDARYAGPVLFALDRIARDASARSGGLELLSAIEIPLPAISASGVGPAIPEAPVVKPIAAKTQVTVTATELYTSALPIAKLVATGVMIDGASYPGDKIALKPLGAALRDAGASLVFAPGGLPARRVVEVVSAAVEADLQLAATTRTGPPGWTMHGAVPVRLLGAAGRVSTLLRIEVGRSADPAVAAIKDAAPDRLAVRPVLEIADDATVATLATVLGALAYREVPAVTLVRKR